MITSPKALTAILALIIYSTAESAQEMSHNQVKKLEQLAACLKSLPKNGDKPVESPCGKAPVNELLGTSSENILRILGNPNWCNKPQQTYVPWTTRDCSSSQEWGYSFYYLPKSYLGGGDELQFTFDKNQSVKSVNWLITE